MVKVALLFPGQGSQYVGMGKYFYDNYTVAKNVLEQASDILKIDVAKMCFQGTKEEIDLTENAQPIILTVGFAAMEVFKKMYDILPSIAAGHSLGEYTALTSAGIFKFEDVLKVVRKRGILMKKVVGSRIGIMTAVNGVEVDIIRNVCEEISKREGIVQLSNYNFQFQTVISGEKAAVTRAEEILQTFEAKCIRLNVSAPFHSKLMKPVAEKMYEVLDTIKLGKFRFPVTSNVTGVPYVDEDSIKDLLVAQIISPVEWTRTMKFIEQGRFDCLIDMGPGNVMKNLARKNISTIPTYSIYSIQKELDKLLG